MPQPTISAADCQSFSRASKQFKSSQASIISVTRSTSCSHTATHRVQLFKNSSKARKVIASHPWHLAGDAHHGQRQDTLTGAFSSSMHEQELHAMLPTFSGRPRHQLEITLFSAPSAQSHRHLDITHGCRDTSSVFLRNSTRSIAPHQLRRTSLVMVSRQSFQLPESKQM